MQVKMLRSVAFWLLLIWIQAVGSGADTGLPEGFVYLDEVVPGIQTELRYASSNNFVGEPIDGYLKARCIVTRPAAEALRGVQEELKAFGLGLKVFDAYRPQRAVDHFSRWAEDPNDVRKKPEFYPDVSKENLFRDGYVAARSAHSRGSAVDLTIVALAGNGAGSELDMGSSFDYFGPQSRPDNHSMNPSQRAHRMLLQTLMKKHGFQAYEKEWWHFTLEAEPFPSTYFDFPIQ